MRFLGRIGVMCETQRNSKELSIQWQIRHFFFLSSKGGDFYDSPDFDFSDARWCLVIYTNGLPLTSPSGSLDLFLERKDSGPPVTIQFTLCITGAEGLEKRRESENKFSFLISSFGFSNFLRRQVLRDHQSILMPNGVLTVTCSMKMKTVVLIPAGGQLSSDQCVICYEKPVDCVLYHCGHMCMCYNCAFKLWTSKSSTLCPICRNSIQDVIKVYK